MEAERSFHYRPHRRRRITIPPLYHSVPPLSSACKSHSNNDNRLCLKSSAKCLPESRPSLQCRRTTRVSSMGIPGFIRQILPTQKNIIQKYDQNPPVNSFIISRKNNQYTSSSHSSAAVKWTSIRAIFSVSMLPMPRKVTIPDGYASEVANSIGGPPAIDVQL